jgi:FkbM family methyltransferase
MGLYEPSVSRWLIRLLLEPQWGCRGRDVWDIGAHVGLLSLLCAKVGHCQVLAIEPAEQTVQLLRAHVRANHPLASQIQILPAAAGATDGEIELLEGLASSENKILEKGVPATQSELENVRKTIVRCVRLDSLLEQGHSAPGILKIDVEGAEALVLRGSAKLLTEFHPTVLLEVHDVELCRTSVSLLQQAGYAVYRIDGSRLKELGNEAIAYGHLLARPARMLRWPNERDA